MLSNPLPIPSSLATMRRLLLILATAGGLLAAGLAAWAATSGGSDEHPAAEPSRATPREVTPEQAAAAVTEEALVAHLEELQAIADGNGGTRESGSPGYGESVRYVVETLRAAGYNPTLQPFTAAVSREVRPTKLIEVTPERQVFERRRDFLVLDYSGSGDATARVVPVDPESGSSGCEESDFDGFPAGAIALVRRGDCFYFVKAGNAEAAGAAAVLIFNEGGSGREGPVSATLVRPTVDIPVVGVTNALGERLTRAAMAGAVRMRVAAVLDNSRQRVVNVLAELPGEDAEAPALLLGAHLDSVAAGPGVNDNGSGVAVVLETAVQLRRLEARPERGMRFAFWGAEEQGLLGSRAYAKRLEDPDELTGVLNFDMVGSPNFARLVYDVDGRIEEAFRAWFEDHDLGLEEIQLEGNSDHASFAELGIPVGGLFTGAEEPKTAAEARLFGGQAGAAHDACYHQACDTVANVNHRVLGQMGDAAAGVALTLAGP
jgi:Zn-dependent M28 family amino/carboxypeptidase